MNDANRTSFNKTTVATVAGIGACILVARYRQQIGEKFRHLINYKDPLRYQKIHVVSNTDDCRRVIKTLRE